MDEDQHLVGPCKPCEWPTYVNSPKGFKEPNND